MCVGGVGEDMGGRDPGLCCQPIPADLSLGRPFLPSPSGPVVSGSRVEELTSYEAHIFPSTWALPLRAVGYGDWECAEGTP